MSRGEDKAKQRQFSIKTLLSITTVVAACLSIPDGTVLLGFMFAFLTFFGLYVDERKAAGIFMIATIIFFIRVMIAFQ